MRSLIRNDDYFFEVFDKDGIYYMSVLTGGFAQYWITIKLDKGEVDDFLQDKNKAIATSLDVIQRTSAYRERIIEPSIEPI